MSLDALSLLFEVETLKRIPRMGWAQRGVPHVESVAEHSHAVTIVALALADLLDAAALADPLSLDKVLAIAALHDLAEVRLTDLPASAQRLLPDAIKSQAEAAAIAELLEPLPGAARMVSWWREFEEEQTPEGCVVRDADKLEMMLQCLRYEQAGARNLDEFWLAMDRHRWHYSLSADLYARLRGLRPA